MDSQTEHQDIICIICIFVFICVYIYISVCFMLFHLPYILYLCLFLFNIWFAHSTYQAILQYNIHSKSTIIGREFIFVMKDHNLWCGVVIKKYSLNNLLQHFWLHHNLLLVSQWKQWNWLIMNEFYYCSNNFYLSRFSWIFHETQNWQTWKYVSEN